MSREEVLYREGYKYQTERDYSIQTAFRPAAFILADFLRMDTDGVLYIRKGYAWDGASGPTLDTKDSMRASLVHDALYQLMREGHLPAIGRALADQEFHRICLEDGMHPIRAAIWYAGVRVGGGPSASPAAERPILSAP